MGGRREGDPPLLDTSGDGFSGETLQGRFHETARTGRGNMACLVFLPLWLWFLSLRSGRPHLRRPSFPGFQKRQSFFLSNCGTIPPSSGPGLPAPSVSFKPSSASCDKYFCKFL